MEHLLFHQGAGLRGFEVQGAWIAELSEPLNLEPLNPEPSPFNPA